MNDDFDSKNIYLRKDGHIIGLHAIGYAEPEEFDFTPLNGTKTRIHTDFTELEKWGNEYDENFKMIGRGSFRIHDLTLDHSAAGFVSEGWEIFEGPTRKEELK